ncbi:uracil phosphoribosyltransferase homolog [Drosophila sechellia]|uniref:Uracil phosphoribosyltransferase homolog n=2 Tax=melanogaster subgroup TaxID=32351 RepID=B4HUJ5_DROSE|nr:uracil phosphoribosyltransferase homolog [Drosophila sechellia]XP_033161463.1 uracil phosphoribosyltransferase homolog [Drosophila mauritiana]XP_039149783.1 uracil phosphoribosyltransferase homolog [Drosophila simulans]EDW50616.1 GM14723 [Drosophila sechellia]
MRNGSPSSNGSQSEEGSSSSDHQQPQQEAQEQEQQLHTPTHAHAAVPAATSEEILAEYGSNLKLLECNSQVAELLTILRDKNTTRSDFKFYADRLIRLVIEESLNQLPYTHCDVETPTGAIYEGLKYRSGNCGVSIIRSGEAMEQGLRDCCRSIRIGKILVESDANTHEARVVYARFPDDIGSRQVLLMYPIMSTGNTVLQAVNVLREHGVPESCIILSNLFCTPMAARTVVNAFPKLKILTSELHPVAPNHFGQKYFGTD